MDLLPHNASPLKVYNQTKQILKNTSRAKNADWYKPATELNLQWHIWVGSYSVSTAIFNLSQNLWFDGPQLPQMSFEKDEAGNPTNLDEVSRNGLHDLLRRILAAREFGEKSQSLGIIFHVADSIRIRDLSPDFSSETDFEGVNELLITAPEIALGDDTLSSEEGYWRLLPLPGAPENSRRSLAVQVSSQYKPIVAELREYGVLRNLPVVVNVQSAPIEAMAAISKILPVKDLASSIFLLQYESFTFLFAIGPRHELLLVRPLIHRSGQSLSPAEIADVVKNTAALLNIRTPQLSLLSLTGMSLPLMEELVAPFREEAPESAVHLLNVAESSLTEGIPDRRIEFWAATRPKHSDEFPVGSLFFDLRENWIFQDFYGQPKSEIILMPTRGDLQLLKASRLFQRVALLLLIAFVGWTGADFFTKMRSEAWKLDLSKATEMEQKVELLKKERREWAHWEKLLAKRSEGWLALETLLELFPANGGVILSSASYRAESSEKGAESASIGLKRIWDLSGYANPEVATSLPNLGSRTRVTELLNRISEENHADYLAVKGNTREVQVTLQQKQGTMPPSIEFPAKVARHFRTSFELSITQSVSGADELAINTAPPSNE